MTDEIVQRLAVPLATWAHEIITEEAESLGVGMDTYFRSFMEVWLGRVEEEMFQDEEFRLMMVEHQLQLRVHEPDIPQLHQHPVDYSTVVVAVTRQQFQLLSDLSEATTFPAELLVADALAAHADTVRQDKSSDPNSTP